eukprot:12359597-Alexandrium_andersonii.AAC.1
MRAQTCGAPRTFRRVRAAVRPPAQGRAILTPGHGWAPQLSVRATAPGPSGAPRHAQDGGLSSTWWTT